MNEKIEKQHNPCKLGYYQMEYKNNGSNNTNDANNGLEYIGTLVCIYLYGILTHLFFPFLFIFPMDLI